MKSLLFKTWAVAAVLAATFVLVGTAAAHHVTVNLSVPDQPAIGQPAQVRGEFHSHPGGAPIAGMTVVLHEQVTAFQVTGDAELAQAMTDANGVATLTYNLSVPGDHELHVTYTNGDAAPEDASVTVTVPASSQQLYRSTAGVSIPGVNVWLLMAVVATVWTVLLTVAVRVFNIAYSYKSGSEAQAPEDPIGGK
jgi:Bacterial Ig-like domain (group 1).